MIISYLGHASFKIKGADATVIFNPFDKRAVGYIFRKTEGDIVLISKEERAYNHLENIKDTPFVISSPGEYEIKGVMVLGFSLFEKKEEEIKLSDNTIYRIEIDGVHICHLGALTSKLSEKEYDQLGKVDIVFVPVGENGMVDARTAAEVVNKLEPAMVIPMCYYDQEAVGEFKKFEKIDKFLEVMGSITSEPISSLRVTASDFNEVQEGTQVMILQRKV